MFLAVLMKTRERMMGMGQTITMLLFFASSPIYPVDIMPHWLRIIVGFNLLSYAIDTMQSLLVINNLSNLSADMGPSS
jgi:ABC-2 type transport system permease protein